jgi:ribokinase
MHSIIQDLPKRNEVHITRGLQDRLDMNMTPHPPSISVLGSLNIDLVTQMDRFPEPGETVVARSFEQFPGGKGANQAVACGRLGAKVCMFGALGKDMFGQRLLQSLKDSHVETEDLLFLSEPPTGMAHIWVDAHGENSIAIIAGANGRIDKEYIDGVIGKISESRWLLLQLEIPLDTMGYLLDRLPPGSPKVILDPAPVRSLEYFPTNRLELITPNEHELHRLTGMSTGTQNEIQAACRALFESTAVNAVMCKAGSRGAFLYDGDRFRHFQGYTVESIDSTAAGDEFNGALTVALSEGKPLAEAINFANGAGALCVMKKGAQTSMPLREDLEAFLRNQNQKI